jgi:endonuclease/exonuclease/phosphatase family metal-dependent hydrolase
MTLRLLSYNIHQGRTAMRSKLNTAALAEAIAAFEPDVVVLQEVAGCGETDHRTAMRQLEALSRDRWPHVAFGGNATFRGGFHGNAVMSRHPIVRSRHLDLSVRLPRTRQVFLPRRGMLWVEFVVDPGVPLRVAATHLGLSEYERAAQVERLCRFVARRAPENEGLVIAGDFNDWRGRVSAAIAEKLHVQEAFLSSEQRHARTFPAQFPLLCLDRIYFRGLSLLRAERAVGERWVKLSDHLPLFAEFRLHAKSAAGQGGR